MLCRIIAFMSVAAVNVVLSFEDARRVVEGQAELIRASQVGEGEPNP